jgi:hypothetical protein
MDGVFGTDTALGLDLSAAIDPYLKHFERRGGVHERCEGLLLYPTAAHPVDFVFSTQGHTVRVVTLDLRAAWTDIKGQLLNLLNPWKVSALPSA